ncbi:OLC1v1014718C1 [Oldenlandia corymbosa var. corymbosa]|uniref:OLC1v1014718C1 n=1 Tax=Oldenlandia corymbosa var. corymbosa TaxID=529605 RepID=A0AAV1E1L9_OLDCO|nr:OLC1v1014718C1 [Oldenlandia corymbosa var. corymbosa]
MASISSVSEVVDPLQSLFGASLFPRTIRAATNAPLPSDPRDLESVHQFMKSVTLNSPDKLLNEAKAIVGAGSELLKSRFPGFMESLGIDRNAVAPEGKENPQERRPGLGCKRPRFSLKKDMRSSVSSEPNVNFNQLSDPEEFFSAFEKAENARREIQRQKGGTMSDLNNYDQSKHKRGRRPGILGRSVNNYKHRYSSSMTENSNYAISTLEMEELDIPGSPTCESAEDKADTDIEAQETMEAGSITETDEGLNNTLGELLSQNIEDIDEDGVQEKLNISSINPGKLSLPEFHGVGRTDFMAFGEKLPKVRKSLANISNLGEWLSVETNVKQKKGGSPFAEASPTSGSMTLLKKRSSQSSSVRDPFSPLNMDPSVLRNMSSGNDTGGQPQTSVLKELSVFGNLERQFENESGSATPSHVESQTAITSASDRLDNCDQDKNLHPESMHTNSRPTKSQSDFVEQGSSGSIDASQNTTTDGGNVDPVIAQDRSTYNVADNHKAEVQSNPHIDDSPQIGSDTGVHVHHLPEEEEMPLAASVHASPEVSMPQSQSLENLCNDQPFMGQPNPPATEDDSMIASSKESKKLQAKPKSRAKRPRDESHEVKALSRRKSLPGQPNPAATENNSVIAPSIMVDITTTTESEMLQPKPKGREKRVRGENREVKALSRRKSLLAEGGTSFESGVRRSKRIRSRPLEFWKGERFLYGRVNEGFKLIGLRYISPGKGDGKLKVKPFVSDDYKEILDLAALH